MFRLSKLFFLHAFLLISLVSIGQQKARIYIDSVVNYIDLSLKSYEKVHMRSHTLDKLEDYLYFIDTTSQKLGKVFSYPNKKGVGRIFYFADDKLLKVIVVKYISKTERREAYLLFSNKQEIYRTDPDNILSNIEQFLKEAQRVHEMLTIIRMQQ